MNQYNESNLFFGLENMDMLDAIAAGKITPKEGDYDSMYEGGLEAELERLTEEADRYKGEATLIALECVNANRAYEEVAKGTDILTAFRMYGFEAEDGKAAEEAVSKKGIFKTIWKAIVGFFSNIISYLAHLLKIKRISGKVFDVIYNDIDKMKKKLNEASSKKDANKDAKVALTKDIKANWDKVDAIYRPKRLTNTVDGEKVELTLGSTDEIKTSEIETFIKRYANNFGVKMDGNKLDESSIEDAFTKHEEDLKLSGADEKGGEVSLSSAYDELMTKTYVLISDYAKDRRGYNTSKDSGSAERGDAIRYFEGAFDGCKKMHKVLQGRIADDKIPEGTTKEELQVLSDSLKAMGKLCARQAKVYNFCLRDFTTLTGYAIKDGSAVLSKLK